MRRLPPPLDLVRFLFFPVRLVRLASCGPLDSLGAPGWGPPLPLLSVGVNHSLQTGSSSESSEIKICGMGGPLCPCSCTSASSKIGI
eukprot:895075-Heterocapsa_arctica.AAC.1